MVTTQLPTEFKEFLQLLLSNKVEYLLIVGHAVGYYGYPRSTGDIDVWIARNRENADRLVTALQEFGFGLPELSSELFLPENQVIRMGVSPLRIEILTTISGVSFEECYAERVVAKLGGVEVSLIS